MATALVRRPVWIVMLVVFALSPARFDARAVALAAGGALALVAVHLGWHLPLCLRLSFARPARPELLDAVRRAEQRVGFSARRTFEVPIATANAFALRSARQLAFTHVAATELDPDELAALAGYVLGPLTEPWRTSLFRLAMTLLLLSVALLRPLIGTFHVEGFLVVELVILLAVRFARPVARRMEARASGVAHAHEGDPGAYARALEHLHRINLMPAVIRSRRGLRPDLYDRLTAAGVVPSYPRPKPPAPDPKTLALLVTAVSVVCCAAPHWIGKSVRDANPGDERTLLETASLDGGDADMLDQLGRLRSQTPAAIVLLSACASVDPDNVSCRSALTMELALAGRCSEAAAEEKRIAWPDQATIDAKRPRLRGAIANCGLRRAGP